MDWVQSIAPLIGTALAGPFGGVAASFIAEKLGLDTKDVKAVTDVLANTKLTPEQVAQVKAAELDMQKFMADNQIKREQLQVDNTNGARTMQAAIRSWVPAFLAVVVTSGFFSILLALMFNKVEKSDALLVMLGSLGTAWAAIINFYFGSSDGSQRKDAILAAKG